MSTVAVTTTQNVDIEYEIANVGDRILAVMIDDFILLGYSLGIGLLGYLFISMGIDLGWAYYIIFFSIPIFVYDFLCELFMNGQSFGKRALRVRVIKLDGSQPSVGDYFIRWIFRLIDVTILLGTVGIITIAVNGKGQRLGDIAAGTTVVRIRKEAGFSDTIFTQLKTDYKPLFPEAARLSGEAAGIIREVLNSGKTIKDKRLMYSLAERTKKTIEDKLGISSSIDPFRFLEIILKDYNYFSDR